MTEEQMIHVGMINSFNVIMGRNTFTDIADSGVNIFAHAPDDEPSFEMLELMLEYFSSFEMFEKCFEIALYMEDNFHKNGTPKELRCECMQPLIESYSKKVYCGTCKKRIKK
jgi:hypothetical protein